MVKTYKCNGPREELIPFHDFIHWYRLGCPRIVLIVDPYITKQHVSHLRCGRPGKSWMSPGVTACHIGGINTILHLSIPCQSLTKHQTRDHHQLQFSSLSSLIIISHIFITIIIIITITTTSENSQVPKP